MHVQKYSTGAIHVTACAHCSSKSPVTMPMQEKIAKPIPKLQVEYVAIIFTILLFIEIFQVGLAFHSMIHLPMIMSFWLASGRRLLVMKKIMRTYF